MHTHTHVHMAALQRCVSFCYTAKRISHTYTYIPPLFGISFTFRSPQSTGLPHPFCLMFSLKIFEVSYQYKGLSKSILLISFIHSFNKYLSCANYCMQCSKYQGFSSKLNKVLVHVMLIFQGGMTTAKEYIMPNGDIFCEVKYIRIRGMGEKCHFRQIGQGMYIDIKGKSHSRQRDQQVQRP